MTKEHPLIFSTPMVQAILEGRKGMTRRMITHMNSYVNGSRVLKKTWDWYDWDWNDVYIEPGPSLAGNPGSFLKVRSKAENGDTRHRIYPIYQLWDKIWGKETYQWDWKDYPERTGKGFFFKADSVGDILASGEKWKPSIFMPKAASRLWLEIISQPFGQRIQDISEEDAMKEGIYSEKEGFHLWFKDYSYETGHPMIKNKPIQSFRTLWQSINGEESWNLNPWTWAISFKRKENS